MRGHLRTVVPFVSAVFPFLQLYRFTILASCLFFSASCFPLCRLSHLADSKVVCFLFRGPR